MVDEIGSSILMGCGFALVEGLLPNRGQKHPFPLFLGVPQVGPLLKLYYKITQGWRLSSQRLKEPWQMRRLWTLSTMKIFLHFFLPSRRNCPLLLPKTPLHLVSMSCSLQSFILLLVCSQPIVCTTWLCTFDLQWLSCSVDGSALMLCFACLLWLIVCVWLR